MASFLTGGTVVAVAHKDGVLMAADTVLNYGSTRRTDNYERIIPVGTHTLIGFTGDEADFKDSLYTLKSMHREARCHGTPPLARERSTASLPHVTTALAWKWTQFTMDTLLEDASQGEPLHRSR